MDWRRNLTHSLEKKFPQEVLFFKTSFETFEKLLQDFCNVFLREDSFHEKLDPEIEETITALVNKEILGQIISCSPILSNELSNNFKKFLKIAVLRNNLDISRKLFDLISPRLSFTEIGELECLGSGNEDLSDIFQNYVASHPSRSVLKLTGYKFSKLSAALQSSLAMMVFAFGTAVIVVLAKEIDHS